MITAVFVSFFGCLILGVPLVLLLIFSSILPGIYRQCSICAARHHGRCR